IRNLARQDQQPDLGLIKIPDRAEVAELGPRLGADGQEGVAGRASLGDFLVALQAQADRLLGLLDLLLPLTGLLLAAEDGGLGFFHARGQLASYILVGQLRLVVAGLADAGPVASRAQLRQVPARLEDHVPAVVPVGAVSRAAAENPLRHAQADD